MLFWPDFTRIRSFEVLEKSFAGDKDWVRRIGSSVEAGY
jgi:hypothetical protein